MPDELKPCPFCGGQPIFGKSKKYGEEVSPSKIMCRKCDHRVASVGPSSDYAVLQLWNTRPIEDALEVNANVLCIAERERRVEIARLKKSEKRITKVGRRRA